MQNNKIAFILERRSDAGTSGGATLDVSSSGSDEEIPSKGNLSELLFQLLWLIGCHKYSIWNWFSLLLGAMKGK